MMSPQFKEEFMAVKLVCEKNEREVRGLQQRLAKVEGLLGQMREVMVRNDQLTKRNHQKWVGVGKQLDAHFETFRKMSEMQGEILRLSEENMQLEGNYRILKVEADGLRQSVVGTQRIGSERDLGISSVSSTYTTTTPRFDPMMEVASPRNRSALSPIGTLQFGNRSYL